MDTSEFSVSSFYISIEAREESFAQYWVMSIVNVSLSQLPSLLARIPVSICGIGSSATLKFH